MYRCSLVGLLSLGLLLNLPALAMPKPEYPVAFAAALHLDEALTVMDTIRYAPTTYQFTVSIPVSAKQSLAQLTITIPDDGGSFGVNLPRIQDVYAYIPANAAGPRNMGQKLTIVTQIVGQVVHVKFEPPVPPGQQITLEMQQMRNPESSGVYLFEINALAAAVNPIAQFVGYGRLTFRDAGGGH